MNIITVNASKTYPIYIGNRLLNSLGSYISQLADVKSVCIISDDNVFPIYGNSAIHSLSSCGFSTCSYVFSAGESSKNGFTYLEILNFLSDNHLSRNDLIVALGGGVVGDLAGFAAATYLRGIRYVQVPTTLLAAVDSSVGGKTAIDLPSGKNLAGAFYQPDLVVCDIDLLKSLPEEVFRDGCAEVIKYAILYDNELFDHLQNYGLEFDRQMVITRCIQWKKEAVISDEFDTGARMKLNLGHTFGHGIEKQSSYCISHGAAVAIGTAIAARVAVWMQKLSSDDCDKIVHLLKKFHLPVTTQYSPKTLYLSALSDKKRTLDSVNLILPRRIGLCDIVPTPIIQLENVIKAGLENGS